MFLVAHQAWTRRRAPDSDRQSSGDRYGMSRNSDSEIDAGSKWPEIGQLVQLPFGPAYAPARGKRRMKCRRPWSRASSESSGNISRKLTSTPESVPVSTRSTVGAVYDRSYFC